MFDVPSVIVKQTNFDLVQNNTCHTFHLSQRTTPRRHNGHISTTHSILQSCPPRSSLSTVTRRCSAQRSPRIPHARSPTGRSARPNKIPQSYRAPTRRAYSRQARGLSPCQTREGGVAGGSARTSWAWTRITERPRSRRQCQCWSP